MERTRTAGGTPISVKLDALAQARLAYAAAFYREVLGVDASNGALIRHALSVLVEDAAKLIKLARRDPEAAKVNYARMGIGWSAQNNPCPWRDGLPALGDKEQFPTFPTWTEAQAPRRRTAPVTIPPIDFESETCTANEQD